MGGGLRIQAGTVGSVVRVVVAGAGLVLGAEAAHGREVVGTELRHQRWLSTPSFVEADPTKASRDTTTFAVGVRGHVKLSDTMWLRPGLAYARGIDDPMDGQKFNVLQLDVPFVF